MLMTADFRWMDVYVPPYVHYFCPLDVALTLKTQEPVPTTEKGR